MKQTCIPRSFPLRRAARAIGARCALALAALALPAAAAADEIRVLAAAMMKPIFQQVVPQFERSSGHRLVIEYATVGGVTKRVLDGEAADLVVASSLTMPGLVAAGRIDAASQVQLCKVGIGMVVPAGTPVPRVRSMEDFRRALLAARTIVYADPARGGAAGIHVAGVIGRLGLAAPLAERTRYGAGGDVTEVTLAQGPGALGITQISEIVDKPGAAFVGPVPPEMQNYTVCAAGLPTGARHREAVAALLATLQGPAGLAALHAKGMESD